MPSVASCRLRQRSLRFTREASDAGRKLEAEGVRLPAPSYPARAAMAVFLFFDSTNTLDDCLFFHAVLVFLRVLRGGFHIDPGLGRPDRSNRRPDAHLWP